MSIKFIVIIISKNVMVFFISEDFQNGNKLIYVMDKKSRKSNPLRLFSKPGN